MLANLCHYVHLKQEIIDLLQFSNFDCLQTNISLSVILLPVLIFCALYMLKSGLPEILRKVLGGPLPMHFSWSEALKIFSSPGPNSLN